MQPQEDPWIPHFAGDRCLVLEFGKKIDRRLVDQVVAMNARISAALLENRLNGVLECVPTFRSLAVIYDPLLTHPKSLIEELRQLDADEVKHSVGNASRFTIPVHYGDESGPDLTEVAALTGLDEQRVIDLHEQTEFSVYMLGFLPGFAFLGDTPTPLHLPRRTEPRVRVPAGSVAIAMQLTGVYPWDSPGGWHILGKCPIPLFDAQHHQPVLFKAGDTVKFKSISLEEFNCITEQKTRGEFDRNTLVSGKELAS